MASKQSSAASNGQDRRDQAGQPIAATIGGSEAFAVAGDLSAETGLRRNGP